MHFANGAVPEDYLVYIRRKYFWIMGASTLFYYTHPVVIGEIAGMRCVVLSSPQWDDIDDQLKKERTVSRNYDFKENRKQGL